jgi:hypothetical protein
MTVREFNKKMSESGFVAFDHPLHIPTFRRVVNGVEQVVCRDNVRGGSYRLFLGHDCIPQMYPAQTDRPNSISAESPWFSYVEAEAKADALRQCWEFLSTIGFQWLAFPRSLTPDEWRERHNVLIDGAKFTRRQGYLP